MQNLPHLIHQPRRTRAMKRQTYANRSSTTVDNVLKIIAFIGMCATL